MRPATLPEGDRGLLRPPRLVCMVTLSVMATGAGPGLAADAGPDDERGKETATPAGKHRPPLPLFVLPKRYLDESPPGKSFTLVPAKDGSKDLVAETPEFTARVAPNGDVRFEDHPAKLSLRPPLPEPVRPGTPTIESVLRGRLKILPSSADRGFEDRPEYRPHDSVIPTPSPYHPDVREECQHPRPCHLDLKPLYFNAGGKFDLTDTLERLRGREPNRYEKARFLALTRELRIQMAVQAHAERLRLALVALPDTLRAIACDEGRPVAERKAILEALQDEMDASLEQGRTSAVQIRAFLARWQEHRDGGAVCP
jgi:hypothetical protein